MEDRPITTLFLLMSVDGKINSGASDELDVDKDWPKIKGVKEGLHQYYEIEATTDNFSLNTGRVMAKIGINQRNEPAEKIDVSFVIVDRKPHLNRDGVAYLCKWVQHLILVTDNKAHPAFALREIYPNLVILYYEKIDLHKMMRDLKEKFDVERLTIQSGGTLNAAFLREDLIDYVDIVIAPLLVGGKETNTLIDGPAITKVEELGHLKAMKLLECEQLADSYLRLKYQVSR